MEHPKPLDFGLRYAFRDRFVEQLLHLTRGLLGQFTLLAAEFALLFAKFALLFSKGTHLFSKLALLIAGVGLEVADLALKFSNLGLDVPDLLHCGTAGTELFQLCFQFFEVGVHVGDVDANLLHLCAEFLLLFAQSFLLFSERFLFFAKLLLRLPELPGAVDGGLVANDVGFFVALEPDEVAGDLLPEFLDMVGVFRRAGHGEGVGLAGDDDEALFVVVAVVIRKAVAGG